MRNDPAAQASTDPMSILRDFFFLALFFILAIVWLVSWAAFHVAGGFIHILLIVAVISLVIHFFTRSRA